MTDREVVLDEPTMDEQTQALQSAVERAERAEDELAKMKHERGTPAEGAAGHAAHDASIAGVEALRHDAMMAHLLDSLEAGKDIGHYGRLVFAMVARHFLTDEETIAELTKDRDFSGEKATAMLRQVEERDYSPPRRERIVEWQAQQEFPILPAPHDPDCGNVYRSLRFPTATYDHIEGYQEEKAGS